MDLPTKNDWDNWSKIEQSVIMIMSDHPIINVIPILIILDNWLNYSRPPTRIEIQHALYEKNLEGLNWWQSIIPSQPIVETSGKIKLNERPNSSEHRLYKILEDRELILSKSFKEMRNVNLHVNVDYTFHLGDTIQHMKHGREKYYTLTPKGKIYLNIMLQKPWLGISLNNEAVARGFLTLSAVSWMYLKKTRDYPSDFKKKINKELEKDFSSSFWKMDSTVIRIITEYKMLTSYKNKYLHKMNKNSKMDELLSKISFGNGHSELQEPFSPEKVISEEFCLLIDGFLKIIEDKAKIEGITKDDLEEQASFLI